MAHLLPEIVEQILIRLKVRDLIRCKSVSKSWHSLISDPRFIKAHLKHSYESDRNNEEIGDRRIVMSKYACFYTYQQFEVDGKLFDFHDCHLLGSSDGLVCVSPSRNEIVVVNPSIREVKTLSNPKIPKFGSLCWGFGYDASTDDYKVVLGFMKGENVTCFQVFSLRSNMWKVIGEINCTFLSRIGILCEGALHWVVYHASSKKKNVILSFNLSEEKFAEVPQPDDVSYWSRVSDHPSMRLGTINGCLCSFQYENLPNDLWMMKNYNVKQSWGIFGPERVIKYEAVHGIKRLKNYIPNQRPLCHEPWLVRSRVFLGNPIYVESLVSPHFHRRLRRRRPAEDTTRSARVYPNNVIIALYAVPRAQPSTDEGTSSGSSTRAEASGNAGPSTGARV
ncbi:F-box protein CPR1-like [Cynara cardunculus var. scolymus]|uniref:F-box protein CPR1-like n=1 Tax=Cynara cardunculus var. scolymus TaxID=59895 RepID=UPI000D62CD14|nr:F-box protein CPR1-like [Cynara cardunculus var. scolymus]XP_024984979.1 F-box protein CPR1-like [Cynara cardunculus var. scolymus]XP_024984981.1 F-box protein CPR1-like [Cynara cardunculus var. scolymus]XP_024984982.1 F-box protein CPR1-like [Cynara cardunculus var. scolymus]